ncbi:hypothetical protein O6P43_001298 [Quillaja saponaria]|uniref:Uncharacterized protein n=1 Tax=Quillaja saponaria TaxID=32244 RepID=A0AAD7QIL5_QUISA|nr:hypothetical protein O6P43_001298 [Quillaja saponaria]
MASGGISSSTKIVSSSTTIVSASTKSGSNDSGCIKPSTELEMTIPIVGIIIIETVESTHACFAGKQADSPI